MRVGDRLREYLGIQNGSGPRDPEVSDEEILNVLRREAKDVEGGKELTAGEIADELSIQSKQTHNRLKDELHPQKRVTKRRAGQTDMWGLSSTETTNIMDPKLGDVARIGGWLRRKSELGFEVGKNIGIIGFVLMFIAVTLPISGVHPSIVDWVEVLALGYTFALVSGSLLAAAGIFKLLGIGLPKFAERMFID